MQVSLCGGDLAAPYQLQELSPAFQECDSCFGRILLRFRPGQLLMQIVEQEYDYNADFSAVATQTTIVT